jgi:hypothetical protein
VNYSINGATGAWTVTVPSTAKAYVHVKNATGQVADFVVNSVPAAAVRLLDVTGDPSSKGLVLDFDALMAAAKTQLASDTAKTAVLDSVRTFRGTFDVNATYTALNVVGPANVITAVPITVKGSGQAAIAGQGIKGKLYVKDCPAALASC